MCRKNIIRPDEFSSEKLVVYKPIEKFRRNIIVEVDTKHRAVIMKDGIVTEVLENGKYKPFTKDDKKKILVVIFVYIAKTTELEFATRVSSIKDKTADKIYSVSFSGNYSFSVRNERKFLGTCFQTGNDFSQYDFADEIYNNVNANILSQIIEFFTANKISFDKFDKVKERLNSYLVSTLDKYLDDMFGLEVRAVNVTEMYIQDEISIR